MKKTKPTDSKKAKKSRRHEAARPNQPAPAKAAASKKAAPAKPAKAVAKPAAKAAVKKPAPKKPAAKAAPKAAPKSAAAATAKKTAPAKPAKAAAVVKKSVPAAKAPAKDTKETKPAATKVSPKETKASAASGKETKEAKAAKGTAPAAPVDAFPALDPNVKRPAKPFFIEVKPGVERVIKRGDKSAASQAIDLQARRKGPATEETSEELAERIERELQSQSFLKRSSMRPQMCTKCGINAVTPRFTIDRELGYCEGCAEILRLGETKEARRMEFNLAAKKDEKDEIAAPGPDEIPAEDGDEEPVPEDIED